MMMTRRDVLAGATAMPAAAVIGAAAKASPPVMIEELPRG